MRVWITKNKFLKTGITAETQLVREKGYLGSGFGPFGTDPDPGTSGSDKDPRI